MMKRFLLFAICFLPSILRAQSSFSIKGYGKAFKDADKIFLAFKQGDQFIVDSTTVHHGSFEFRGTFKTKARGYLSRNDNPLYAADLSDSFYIYIEEGNIILRSPDSLNNSIVSGTPLNNDFASLRAALKPLYDKKEKLNNLLGLKDHLPASQNDTEAKVIDNEILSRQFNFINEHPNSYVSLLTLNQLARTSKNLPEVALKFARLAAGLKALPEGLEIASRIKEGKKISVGMMAKDFSQNDVDGKLIKLSSYQGKYVLVDFWASWCGPCRTENPNVLAVYEQHKEKNFTVLSVSIDTDKAKWLNAIREDKLPWVQVSDLKKENEAAKLYGIKTIPANVLVDPNGKIIAKDIKGKELRDKLAEIFGAK